MTDEKWGLQNKIGGQFQFDFKLKEIIVYSEQKQLKNDQNYSRNPTFKDIHLLFVKLTLAQFYYHT